MTPLHEIMQSAPSSYTEVEIQDFVAMVRAGGEVGSTRLEQNVRSAQALLTARKGDCLVAVAALKTPALSYRKNIQTSSRITLDQVAFPFELGYVFVLPSARGQGLATKLCEMALEDRASVGIFATTRVTNAPMANILQKVGFENQRSLRKQWHVCGNDVGGVKGGHGYWHPAFNIQSERTLA